MGTVLDSTRRWVGDIQIGFGNEMVLVLERPMGIVIDRYWYWY